MTSLQLLSSSLLLYFLLFTEAVVVTEGHPFLLFLYLLICWLHDPTMEYIQDSSSTLSSVVSSTAVVAVDEFSCRATAVRTVSCRIWYMNDSDCCLLQLLPAVCRRFYCGSGFPMKDGWLRPIQKQLSYTYKL
jgi:hypothetical protein